MSSQAFNLEELHHRLSEQIEEYSREVSTQDTPDLTKMQSLIDVLITERSLVLDEIDDLRADFRMHTQWYDTRLILKDLPTETFNQLNTLARRFKISPGKLLSILMQKFLEYAEGDDQVPVLSANDLSELYERGRPGISVGHLQFLSVTDEDLEDLNRRISINHIDLLDLSSISVKALKEKIKQIRHCKTVIFSNKVPFLLIYAKTFACKEIRIVDDTEEDQ